MNEANESTSIAQADLSNTIAKRGSGIRIYTVVDESARSFELI